MSLSNPKIGSYHFTVEPGIANAMNELPLPRLIEWLLLVAAHHAGERGWGYSRLKENDQTWVLIRLAIECVSYPTTFDTLTFETGVEGINKHFSSRDFRVVNSEGKVCFYAKSLWTVIDLSSRKSVDLLAVASEIEQEIVEMDCPIDSPKKIGKVSTNKRVIIPIKFSDLDVNRHVNSSRYAQYIVDALGVEWHLENQIARMEINFQSEILFNELIELKIQNEPNLILFELFEQETEKVKSKIALHYKSR